MAHDPPKDPEARILPGHPFFDLIEEAYRVFAGPKPTDTGVCKNCCMDRKIEKDFFNPPIRGLPLSYLRDWYNGAWDPGEMPRETWSYLLPRILECLATGEEVARIGLEVTLDRYKTGQAGEWSAKQWSVLDRFQRQFLRRNADEDGDALDTVLCMFALGGWPVDALIDQVSAYPDAVLAGKLCADWAGSGLPYIRVTPFWKDSAEILDFYTSASLRDRMEALALDDATDPRLASKASAVVDIIETSSAA